jgi:hypothetical protein
MYLWSEMQLKMYADQEYVTRRTILKGWVGYRLQSVVATMCRNFVNWSTFSALHLAANI